MSPENNRKPPDYEDVLRLFHESARQYAVRLHVARVDAGMDPAEARESVRRWGRRLAAKVVHGVDTGLRDSVSQMTEGPPNG